MELGNLLFGNSRGAWQIPRTSAYIAPIYELYNRISDRIDDNGAFSCDAFTWREYYWGDCTCGYEDAAHRWSEEHSHRHDCYQVKYQELYRQYGGCLQIPERSLKALCREFGIDYNDGSGSAVHCTCDHDPLWLDWCSRNDHAPDCPIVQHNLEIPSANIRVDWYKRPLRDAYANREISPDEWFAAIMGCLSHV